MRIRHLILALFLFSAFIAPAKATVMDMVSDLISTSAPGYPADHRMQFTLPHDIPASGKIIISFDPGAFSFPSNFDYTDVDLAVWDGISYVDRSIAATPSAFTDGVSVVGDPGVITIQLSSSSGIPAGSKVQVRLGLNATFDDTGTVQILNPPEQKSYRIGILTTDNVGAQIDYATAMIATVEPVTLHVPLQNIAPTPSQGMPSGVVAAGSKSIELAFATDRTASCRYSLTPGTAYSDMTNSFSPKKGVFFYTVLSGYEDNTTYTYYVRCIGSQGAVNTSDYIITFSLAPTASSNTSITQAGGQVGTGDVPNGSQVLYLSTASLSGFTSAGATVQVLKDGVNLFAVTSGVNGAFHADIPSLERGTYTFTVYAIDKAQRKSAPYSSTLAVDSGTSNTISNILLPPTIALEKNQVASGGSVHVSGEATPNSIINVTLTPKPDPKDSTKNFTATTTADGTWDLKTPAVTQNGTYIVRARQKILSAESDYSGPVYVGVGQAPSQTSLIGDLNFDGKVNLIDFSILLTIWDTSAANGDLNNDGKVNLADLSIMLFNWTG